MSVTSPIPAIELASENLFDHSKILKTEIDAFLDNFERNDRHKEFDGIIRSSHILYEAVETPVEALLENNSNIGDLLSEVNKTTERILDYAKPRISDEYNDYIKNIHLSQTDIVRVVEHELAKMSSERAVEIKPLKAVEEAPEESETF
uniref:Biogenesis of lysosome-related organelles complex 1 subunit 2 n=1 Tax=Steinernema glaseri TaxID=37863 RepID=A0A1I7Z1B9_9BILA